jgi:peptidyl-prolyl cis-trans isomerase C
MLRYVPRFAASVLFAGLLAAVVTSPVSASEHGDPVVARVDGMEIYLSDVEDSRLRLPERFQTVPLESVFGFLVNSLVDSKLIAAEARKINLHESTEIRKTMDRIEEQILERAFLTAYIEKRITDEELQVRYQQLVKDSEVKEEIQARHILLETEAQAREVIAELEGGGDFAELAKSRSTGPSAASGGDLGFFGQEQMVPAFSSAAFGLEKGAYTAQPVQTQFGWHVIKLEDRRQVEAPSFDVAEAELRQEMSREIGADLVQNIRQAATVERFNLDGTLMQQPVAE